MSAELRLFLEHFGGMLSSARSAFVHRAGNQCVIGYRSG
jgi:hypothetical protein